jgi:hypothetical protein
MSERIIGETDPHRVLMQNVTDDLCEQVISMLGAYETSDLVAMADYRESVCPDGWMQQMIRDYVDVWR